MGSRECVAKRAHPHFCKKSRVIREFHKTTSNGFPSRINDLLRHTGTGAILAGIVRTSGRGVGTAGAAREDRPRKIEVRMYKSRKAVEPEPLVPRANPGCRYSGVAYRPTAPDQRFQAEDYETKTAIQMHRLIHVDNVW
jgi:hypothetical protein